MLLKFFNNNSELCSSKRAKSPKHLKNIYWDRKPRKMAQPIGQLRHYVTVLTNPEGVFEYYSFILILSSSLLARNSVA